MSTKTTGMAAVIMVCQKFSTALLVVCDRYGRPWIFVTLSFCGVKTALGTYQDQQALRTVECPGCIQFPENTLILSLCAAA